MDKAWYAHYDAKMNRISVGNQKICKTVETRGSYLRTERVEDLVNGKVWTGEEKLWQRLPVLGADETPEIYFTAIEVLDHPCIQDHLKAILRLTGENGTVWYEFIVFPEAPFVYTQAFVEKKGEAARSEEQITSVSSSGIERNQTVVNGQEIYCGSDTLDCIPLSRSHLEVESFMLYDKTDINDSLLERQTVPVYFRGIREMEGNIFRISDYANGDSLLLVKHSPTPSSALNRSGKDLLVMNNRYAVLKGTGIDYACLPEEKIPCYASAVGTANTSEIMEEFWRYSASFSKGDIRKKLFIMSNTWGDRSQDLAVCEEFMLREIECGHKIGVDIVQIDDGWQLGMSANTLRASSGTWEGYYRSDPDFWAVDPAKFPRGLTPVVQKAAEYGIEIGLWFSPDSSDEFANYARDIETLWAIYQTYGIRFFKLDGVKIRSKLCEKRFIHILETLTLRSRGEISFNLDVTAEDRFGYLYQMQYGTLFVENRYTDWGNYYPHNTFKNLWNLSAILPARRLQMELLNNNRNQDKYVGMPFAPSEYGMDYLFAVTIPANPLVWMEMSHLQEADAALLTKVIAEYKGYASELFAARIIPIGEAPNGMHFSGYFCRNQDGRSGHLILFREQTKGQSFVFDVPIDLRDAKMTVVYESAPAAADSRNGGIRVCFEKQRSFIWMRYEL